MSWLDIALLGGTGGLIASVLALYSRLRAWKTERRYYLDAGLEPPGLTTYFDFPAELAVALSKVTLGCLAALIFRDQVPLMIGVGAAGPALLDQLLKGPQDPGSTTQNTEEATPNSLSVRNDAPRPSALQARTSSQLQPRRKRVAKHQAAHRKKAPRAGPLHRPRET